MGLPVPGWEVSVVDDDGGAVEAGEVANVVVRYSPRRPVGLFPGYYEDAEASAGSFRAPFYFTGDKAARDEDGYFWFEGRNDDVITSSAYRIGPFEVESALIEHPAVMEAAVVARPDTTWGESPCAFVTLKPGAALDDQALIAWCRERIAHFKAPRTVVFGPLPKTATGKIQKFVLRDRARKL
jgi:acetyl-CoA synthetase